MMEEDIQSLSYNINNLAAEERASTIESEKFPYQR